MSARWIGAATLAGGLCALLLAGCARAQAGGQGSLAARVQGAPDGEVRMHFTSRPGVCGSENGISTGNRPGRRRGERVVVNGGVFTGHGDDWECVEGPVHVRLLVRGGRIADLKTRVARGWSEDLGGRVTDLGRVPAREASDYLLSLAERADGEVGEDAVFPATIADSSTTWPRLLRIARNDAASEKTRRSAVFWLGQQAGDQVTQGLADLVDDDDQDRELREHAVFALSQRPREESVPQLIRVARTHRDPHIRRTALFWLGQSHDPRAIALFEEILSQ